METNRKIQGINVKVDIQENFGMVHVQFYADNDTNTWISETGYRSQFISPEEVKGMTDEQIVDYTLKLLGEQKGISEEKEQNKLGAWFQ